MANSKRLQHLFVYGTLAPNQSNAHILAPINGTWQPAFICGKLFPNGVGATFGFPAVLPAAVLSATDGEIVRGLVFSSNELDQHWQRIDEFEGEGYVRRAVETLLDNGEKLTAFMYALDPKELTKPL